MLTVIYEDNLPGADEIERLAAALSANGSLGPDDAERAVRVLRAMAAGLKGAALLEHVSDEGFD